MLFLLMVETDSLEHYGVQFIKEMHQGCFSMNSIIQPL
jgi:hypothetical protein